MLWFLAMGCDGGPLAFDDGSVLFRYADFQGRTPGEECLGNEILGHARGRKLPVTNVSADARLIFVGDALEDWEMTSDDWGGVVVDGGVPADPLLTLSPDESVDIDVGVTLFCLDGLTPETGTYSRQFPIASVTLDRSDEQEVEVTVTVK